MKTIFEREIKFRAWDGEQMLTNIGSVNLEMVSKSVVMENEVDTLSVVFMQFTGLLDKNGKEIYEGDILAGHNPKYDGPPSLVQWNEEEARFCIYRGSASSGYVLSAEVKWNEVIGNIYESSDLLV